MLELKNVTKRFSSIPAVDDVSFTAQARRGYRLPRPQRLGQIHHHENDHGPDRAAFGHIFLKAHRFRTT